MSAARPAAGSDIGATPAMYTSFFGLNENPFSITPDPRYLFLSERHAEALAHLVYGVTESGGFMQLTGEVGTGKTTLVRTLLSNRMPENADVAVVLNPQLSPLEFLETICEELGIAVAEDRGSSKALIDRLNRHLLAAHADGRRTILVVDEAQNLSRDVLEQVRLLTNLETSKQKLLQIVLIGQPELRDLLARNDLRQLTQRITGRYHLEPLSRDETAQYIEHRLRVAGALGEIFNPGAKREMYRLTQGVPRLINQYCDRALLGAYGLEVRHVDRRLVRRAAAEVSGVERRPRWRRWALPAVATVVGTAGIAMLTWRPAVEVFNAFVPDRGDSASLFETAAATTDDELPASEPAVATADASGGTQVTPAASAPVPGLEEQLRVAADLTGPAVAMNTLFGLWGLEFAGEFDTACRDAETMGYACLTQRGSLGSLRQLDRPAILTLTDSGGEDHRVVLTALYGDQAEVSIGGVGVAHPAAEISSLWLGQYLMLWKPPNGRSTELGPGAVDSNVAWLRQSLAAIDERYSALPLDSEVYDAELEQRVRVFQRDNRLDVDGLAGRQTQIIINSLLALDGTPRLVTARLGSLDSRLSPVDDWVAEDRVAEDRVTENSRPEDLRPEDLRARD